MKLKDCRVRHRERSEKLKEEQFIIDDDDGMCACIPDDPLP